MGNAKFCLHFGVGKIKINKKNTKSCLDYTLHTRVRDTAKYTGVTNEWYIYIYTGGNLTITIAHTESADSDQHISLYGL